MAARALAGRIAGAALAAAFVAAPFVGAGTLAWPAAWISLGLLSSALVAHAAFVARNAPGLRERRVRARLVPGIW